MNSQEIISAKEAYVTVKLMAEGKLEELNSQLAQLAEAEKPKLRHGDFGYTDDGYVRIAIKCREKNDLMQLGHVSMPVDGCENKMNTVLGNIFDLMKGWGKDFNGYEAVVMDSVDGGDKVLIEHSSRSKDKIFIGSKLRGQRQLGIHLSKSELEGFWVALGHALMDLKRKLAL